MVGAASNGGSRGASSETLLTRPRIASLQCDPVVWPQSRWYLGVRPRADRDRDRVLFNGPTTDAEAAVWRDCHKRANEISELLKDVGQILAGVPDDSRTEVVRSLKAERQMIMALYPPPSTRRAPAFNLDRWRLDQLKRLAKSDLPQMFLEPIRASRVIPALELRVHGKRRRRK